MFQIAFCWVGIINPLEYIESITGGDGITSHHWTMNRDTKFSEFIRLTSQGLLRVFAYYPMNEK